LLVFSLFAKFSQKKEILGAFICAVRLRFDAARVSTSAKYLASKQLPVLSFALVRNFLSPCLTLNPPKCPIKLTLNPFALDG
jgi:hypothetical protein